MTDGDRQVTDSHRVLGPRIPPSSSKDTACPRVAGRPVTQKMPALFPSLSLRSLPSLVCPKATGRERVWTLKGLDHILSSLLSP